MGGDKQPKANNKFFRKINRFSFNFIEGKIDFHEKPNSTYNDNEILQTLLFFRSGIGILKMDVKDIRK